MHVRKYLSIFLIGLVFAIAGCSNGGSTSGISTDLDKDGIADIHDGDVDGDGIPNGLDPDIDGDGIPNKEDPDMDGDGKPNGKDPDPDGDGLLDFGPGLPGQCPDDASGKYPACTCPAGAQYIPSSNDCVPDGLPNYGPGATNLCDTIHLHPFPQEGNETLTGTMIKIGWELRSKYTGDSNCLVNKSGLVRIKASAPGAVSTATQQTNPINNNNIQIKVPHTCNASTISVTYDFTEIAKLLKAKPKDPVWTPKRKHPVNQVLCDSAVPEFGPGDPGQCPGDANRNGIYPDCQCPLGYTYVQDENDCIDDDLLGFGPGAAGQCPDDATGTYPSCSCPAGQQYNESKNDCVVDIPAGFYEIACASGDLIATNTRGTATWHTDATKQCADNGWRLPDHNEMRCIQEGSYIFPDQSYWQLPQHRYWTSTPGVKDGYWDTISATGVGTENHGESSYWYHTCVLN